jgi:hypothetical protein
MIAILLFLWQIRPSFPYEEDPPTGPPGVTHE